MAKLQADLEEMQPQLEQAQEETEQTMAKIEKDSGESNNCVVIFHAYIYLHCLVYPGFDSASWSCLIGTCSLVGNPPKAAVFHRKSLTCNCLVYHECHCVCRDCGEFPN